MKTMMDFITAVTEGSPGPATMEESAINISNILSGWYRKITPDEWQYLADHHLEWMQKRNALENELDGHFLNNNPAAGKEVFYQLVEHLRTAPIDELTTRIARQLDKL